MIDLEKANKEFEKYVEKYNPEDSQIKLRINHIKRVENIAKNIAKDLELNQEDIELAGLIGLLHDIGRFEQVRIYHTFDDKKSINHGEYGVKILFEEKLIRKFIKEEKYDTIIEKAIINHSKNRIEKGLSKQELLHAKILRDADKTDIMYVLTTDDTRAIYGRYDISDSIMTEEIFREFMEDNEIQYAERKSPVDFIISFFAYIFDFYFNYGLKYIEKQNYLSNLYNRYQFKDKKTQTKLKEAYEYAKKYLEKELKNNKE